MKKLITLALLSVSLTAMAADTVINRTPLGSGSPGELGNESAYNMPDNLYFAPQYMPGFPTAATIWPRVVEVPCDVKNGVRVCEGYHWTPKMGRGEYLLFVPVNRTLPTSTVTIVKEKVPVVVYVEVPRKKKAE